MLVLRIEHPVPDFGAWKKAFDSDPAGRQQSGVRCYRVLRPRDDPKYVAVELELETPAEAEALLAKLQTLWGRVEGRIIGAPQARIFEVAERKEYVSRQA
jgi:hypothetical protein